MGHHRGCGTAALVCLRFRSNAIAIAFCVPDFSFDGRTLSELWHDAIGCLIGARPSGGGDRLPCFRPRGVSRSIDDNLALCLGAAGRSTRDDPLRALGFAVALAKVGGGEFPGILRIAITDVALDVRCDEANESV